MSSHSLGHLSTPVHSQSSPGCRHTSGPPPPPHTRQTHCTLLCNSHCNHHHCLLLSATNHPLWGRRKVYGTCYCTLCQNPTVRVWQQETGFIVTRNTDSPSGHVPSSSQLSAAVEGVGSLPHNLPLFTSTRGHTLAPQHHSCQENH